MKTGFDVPRHPVSSGSYMVSEGKNEIINAYLGSCVGVSLCDRYKDVGGLIHLLLPEPPGADMTGRPENYALTGLPVFIKALCNEGAKIDNLEACVAGGALVGPLSEMDLRLDIGGRTVDIVEKTLHKGGIPVIKSETGGYFSCCLNLSLKSWETHIEPINIPRTTLVMDFQRPSAEGLDNMIKKVQPVPQIALKVIRMIRDNKQSLQDMAKEIRQDQIISAQVIKFCNSAFFHLKMKVDSIDRALVILGEKRLLQIVVSAAFEGFFSQDFHGYSLCKGGLFNHAQGTALISEQLAKVTGKVSSDIAYTGGLLHDIGKVVLDRYMGSAYPLFYRRIQEDGENLTTVEQEIFGVTHSQVGMRLAEKWSLPESLMEVIGYHHHPEQASSNTELIHLVYLADLLMSRFMVGQELERLSTESLASRLLVLGIKPEQFPAIVDSIPRQLFNLSQTGT